jgi:expansin (peptidoglycan-binding protein)
MAACGSDLEVRMFMNRRWFGILSVTMAATACQTTDWSDEGDGKVYLRGRGIAKYHHYDSVRKCKTAFGLDPDAFKMRVTAASSQITKKFPSMGKVGKRGGPYDSTARCIRVNRQGTDRTIVVRAIDICCGGDLSNPKSHQLDLSLQAFEQLGAKSLGNLAVNWAVIDCPKSLRVESDDEVCSDAYYFVR